MLSINFRYYLFVSILVFIYFPLKGKSTAFFDNKFDSIVQLHLNQQDIPELDKHRIGSLAKTFSTITYPLKKCQLLYELAENLSEGSWMPYNQLLYEYSNHQIATKKHSGNNLKMFRTYYASSLNNRAIIDRRNNNSNEALKKYYEACKIFNLNNNNYKLIEATHNCVIIEMDNYNYINAYKCLKIIEKIIDKTPNIPDHYYNAQSARFFHEIGLDSLSFKYLNDFKKDLSTISQQRILVSKESYYGTLIYLKQYNRLEKELLNDLKEYQMNKYEKAVFYNILIRSYSESGKYILAKNKIDELIKIIGSSKDPFFKEYLTSVNYISYQIEKKNSNDRNKINEYFRKIDLKYLGLPAKEIQGNFNGIISNYLSYKDNYTILKWFRLVYRSKTEKDFYRNKMKASFLQKMQIEKRIKNHKIILNATQDKFESELNRTTSIIKFCKVILGIFFTLFLFILVGLRYFIKKNR